MKRRQTTDDYSNSNIFILFGRRLRRAKWQRQICHHRLMLACRCNNCKMHFLFTWIETRRHGHSILAGVPYKRRIKRQKDKLCCSDSYATAYKSNKNQRISVLYSRCDRQRNGNTPNKKMTRKTNKTSLASGYKRYLYQSYIDTFI